MRLSESGLVGSNSFLLYNGIGGYRHPPRDYFPGGALFAVLSGRGGLRERRTTARGKKDFSSHKSGDEYGRAEKPAVVGEKLQSRIVDDLKKQLEGGEPGDESSQETGGVGGQIMR